MKECCKTGNEEAPSTFKKIASRIVWGIVVLLIFGVVYIYFFKPQ